MVPIDPDSGLRFDQDDKIDCVTFTVVDDNIQEGTEFFDFTFTLPGRDVRPDYLLRTPTSNIVRVAIIDNDGNFVLYSGTNRYSNLILLYRKYLVLFFYSTSNRIY